MNHWYTQGNISRNGDFIHWRCPLLKCLIRIWVPANRERTVDKLKGTLNPFKEITFVSETLTLKRYMEAVSLALESPFHAVLCSDNINACFIT